MKKRYKRFRWAQYILFVLSIASCTLPIVVSSIRIIPTAKTTGSKFALGGVAAFFCAVIVLIVCKSLVVKFISKLPFTLTVLLSIGAMLLLMLCLKQIIDDAIAILLVGLIGALAGFALELGSMLCKSMAEEAKAIYLRGLDNV